MFECAHNRHKKNRFFSFLNFRLFGVWITTFPRMFFFHFFNFFLFFFRVFFFFFFIWKKKTFSIFFCFFFLGLMLTFIFQTQKDCKYCMFTYFINLKLFLLIFPAAKREKSKKSIFFVPVVCTLKIFCETTLWCYVVFQKFSRDVWTSFRYLKNSPKNFFSEKKAIVLFFREKKKNRKIGKFGRSAKIGQIYFGDKNLGIRRIFCINIF